MKFEWDEEKDKKNITKHDIGFRRAATIFIKDVVSSEDERKFYGEVRIKSIGMIDGDIFSEDSHIQPPVIVVIVVIHTSRKSIIRIISARAANKKERKLYHGYIKKNKNSKHDS